MYINTQSMSLKTYVRYKIKLLEKDVKELYLM